MIIGDIEVSKGGINEIKQRVWSVLCEEFQLTEPLKVEEDVDHENYRIDLYYEFAPSDNGVTDIKFKNCLFIEFIVAEDGKVTWIYTNILDFDVFLKVTDSSL